MAERLLADVPDQKRVLRRAWPHLRHRRGALARAVAVNLASAAAFALVPVLVGRVVDRLTAGDRDGVLALCGVVLALVLARTVLLRASERMLTRVGELVVTDLRDEAVERLGAAPLRFVEQHRGGDLLQRTTTEIAELAAFIRGQLPDLLSVLGYLAFSAVLLVGYSWQLALVLLVVFLPPMAGLTRGFRRAADEAYPRHAEAESELAAVFTEGLGAREQLQLAGATATWTGRLEARTAQVRAAYRKVQAAILWLDASWLAQAAATAALLLAGGALVGGGTVTVGVVVMFVLAGRELFNSVDDLAFLAGELVETRSGLARLVDLLEATEPAPEGTGIPGGGGLAAHDVRFAYAGAEVLHGVSVMFAAGERAGLVGHTGSGKTTLTKLLCGLYRPTGGQVTLGGRPLDDLPRAELRRRVVLIPQDVHLITGTLAENLALTPGAPDRAAMLGALDRLGLTGWRDLEDPLGARGSALSAGERQLVGLLRAALVGPDVLVLDEATADLDPATAARIEAALDVLHEGRTLIVVAHRQTTIDRLPRVVRLSAGRVEDPLTIGRTT
jgi:ATP-binding cassette, subfamily B, bacterial